MHRPDWQAPTSSADTTLAGGLGARVGGAFAADPRLLARVRAVVLGAYRDDHAMRAERRARGARGQALVELALITPVLLLMVLGAIDVGRLFFAHVAVENAAKEGALFGSTNPTCDTDRTGCGDPSNVAWHVSSELSGLTGASTAIQCFNGAGASVSLTACDAGSTYRVTVAYPFQLITPFMSALVGNTLTLTGTANAAVFNAGSAGPSPPAIPAADFSETPFSGAAPLTVQFTDLSTNSPTSWKWDFGDSTGFSGSENPSYVYVDPGTYTVTLIATNAGGDSLPVTHQVTVSAGASPSPTPTASASPSCVAPTLTASVTPTTGTKNKDPFTFSGTTSEAAVSWSWAFGDGTIINGAGPTIPNQTHKYAKAGTYTALLTVTTGSTCASTLQQHAPTVTVTNN